MASIASSTFEEGPAQVDGRRYVTERHTDTDGRVYIFEWLGDQDASLVLSARATSLNSQLAARAAADALVSGTLLPLTKLQFKRLFTQAEMMQIDAFNASFEANNLLTTEQKAAIRTGLENYRLAVDIPRPFDADVESMLDLYVALGLLTTSRKSEIMAAGNG